ncbi:MAG TPA: PaaI family thioesterase [Gammaproteobacteria bacterium]|nr:PaaI family thioesterase [Gammaproteobacteria bacterium]
MPFNILRLLRRARFLSARRRLEWYPPFWLMGVKVVELDDGWMRVRLRLPLNARSRNLGDAMFGGYQAALADPVAALACARQFPGYSVWTRTLSLDFERPGDTDLELRFEFDPAQREQIRLDLERRGRSTPEFEYGLYVRDGTRCTRVLCSVAIRPRGYTASRRP